MNFSEAFAAIERRQISLVPALNQWVATVDQTGDTLTTKKRKVKSIFAVANTPAEAVEALVAKLDAEAKQQTFGEDEFWPTAEPENLECPF